MLSADPEEDAGGIMKRFFVIAVFSAALICACNNGADIGTEESKPSVSREIYHEITGTIKRGETFFDIFKKYNLDLNELYGLKKAALDVHRLRKLLPGQQYKITVDENDRVNSFEYVINDDAVLSITRTESGFSAERRELEYEKTVRNIGGIIKDNLISSIGDGKENEMLALQLSDIFAWDIDFSTDLRNRDTFKIVVEALYRDGEFKKYGEVISAEFMNNGKTYHAYRFEVNGKADYFDDQGKSLKKAFLKAPLSFRRISSTFSRGRFHPVLKIYRPHHGLDYAAPTGTPVSSVSDGKVVFAGRKGQYGKFIMVRHRNGYKTCYGHLSRIGKGVRKGKSVEQGEVIGYVGSTGLATGPHLHYEIRINDRPVNPLAVKLQ
jgi:murein DD-endopeptidase MepM/ murein hydrolase activator NlpD